MRVDRELVDYVADLAKLRLDEGERETIAEQLGRILEYVEQLRGVDVSDVPPTKHVIEISNVSRPDTERDCLTAEEALANAPQSDQDILSFRRSCPTDGAAAR